MKQRTGSTSRAIRRGSMKTSFDSVTGSTILLRRNHSSKNRKGRANVTPINKWVRA